MVRVPALFLIVLALPAAAAAQEEAQQPKEPTVPVHGHELQISCSEWRRNSDGSWTSTGPLLVGKETVKEATLRGAKETGALEAKCGGGAPASVKPPKPGDQSPHVRKLTRSPPAQSD